MVACWLAHVFCHGAETRLVPVRKGSEPERGSKVVGESRGMRGTRSPPREHCGQIFGRQPLVYQDFSRGFQARPVLVYLVDDPAGVFLYPVIFIDMGWRTRMISDT